MIGIQDLPLFIVAGLALNITPGQDTIYIIGRSAAGGAAGALTSLRFVAPPFSCNKLHGRSVAPERRRARIGRSAPSRS